LARSLLRDLWHRLLAQGHRNAGRSAGWGGGNRA
jgi:hypothetical protein